MPYCKPVSVSIVARTTRIISAMALRGCDLQLLPGEVFVHCLQLPDDRDPLAIHLESRLVEIAHLSHQGQLLGGQRAGQGNRRTSGILKRLRRPCGLHQIRVKKYGMRRTSA